MARLFGAQKLVLQAILDSPRDPSGFVTDAQVAQGTNIALKDVRDWIETLEGEGYVDVARTTAGLSVLPTAKGRLQLGLYEPIPPSQAESAGPASHGPVVMPATDSSPVTTTEVPSTPTFPSPPPVPSPSTGLGTTPTANDVDGFQVVLLIHGIRTQADWGPMVRSKLEVPGQIEVIPIKYGYFDAFRFWFPFWTRSKPVEKVYVQIRVALQKYKREHPDAKLSIIAHSFGTYVVGQILKRGFDLQFHRLLLCGSVLRQDFPWEQYQGRFDEDKLVNECGKADIWPVLAQSASWGYGASGTHGFGAVLVKDRYHAGGHGQYFDPKFVEKFWEPFIRRGEYEGSDFEVKMPPTPWWVSVLGILPLKWVIVFVMAFVLFAVSPIGRKFIDDSMRIRTDGVPKSTGGSNTSKKSDSMGTQSRVIGSVKDPTDKGDPSSTDQKARESNRPSNPINLADVKDSVRQHFEQPLGAPTDGILNPSIGEQRLKQAVFLSLPQSQYDLSVIKQAIQSLEHEQFFTNIMGYADLHANSVIGQLATVREARAGWLRDKVVPSLGDKSEADVPLPDYAVIDHSRKNPVVRMTHSEVEKELIMSK